MAILGGSPLGLINVRSTPTDTGLSTFNGGRSRNVNVNLYNVGKETDKERMGKTNNTKGGIFSLFTGGNVVRPWPNVAAVDYSGETPKLGVDENYGGVSRKTLHNNDVYDTSILNIIEKTANTAAALRPSDFAYLKNLGVFPNNRLIIARRFASPVTDDIFIKAKAPVAIMISWIPQNENFLELIYGEEWIEAKADFTEMINNIASDLLGKSVGGTLSGMLNAVPLPGFTETLTRQLLTKLGVYEEGAGQKRLPAGDPNLIKEAKRRKTIKYEEAGSGLKCTCSIKMTCEYEQKFISGIDPTIAWQDIVANAVRFGTSPGSNYGLSKSFGQKLVRWVKYPNTIVSDFASYIKSALEGVRAELEEYLQGLIDKASSEGDDAETPAEEPDATEEAEAEKSLIMGAFQTLVDYAGKAISKTIQKYEEEVKGIVASLSGVPSTPWHVAVGNPLRPVFCSGDMYTTDVTLKLGPVLSFNDMPSSITVEFTLQNARAWGLTEILAKFNTGHLRTVNTVADDKALDPLQNPNPNTLVYSNTTSGVAGMSPSNTTSGAVSNLGAGTTIPTSQGQIDASTSGVANTTKENEVQQSINPDPNSQNPAVENEKPTVTAEGSNNTSNISPAAKATGESKFGYTYTIVNEGGQKRAIATNKPGVLFQNGTSQFYGPPFDEKVSDDVIIQSLKKTIGDPPTDSTTIDNTGQPGPANTAGTGEVQGAVATTTGQTLPPSNTTSTAS